MPGKGKYRLRDPRPLYKFDSAGVVNFHVIVQETDSSYLIIPVYPSDNSLGFTVRIATKSWVRKETNEKHYVSENKIGEIEIAGYDNRVVNIHELTDLVKKFFMKNTSNLNEEPVEVSLDEINEIESSPSLCKVCGCGDNDPREDGIVRCKECGVYYVVQK